MENDSLDLLCNFKIFGSVNFFLCQEILKEMSGYKFVVLGFSTIELIWMLIRKSTFDRLKNIYNEFRSCLVIAQNQIRFTFCSITINMLHLH